MFAQLEARAAEWEALVQQARALRESLTCHRAGTERWPEFAGGLVLYFLCVPAKHQGLDIAHVLRGLLPRVRASSPVEFALRAWVALCTAEWGAFLHLHRHGTWAQRALMAPRLRAPRAEALARLRGACVQQQWTCYATERWQVQQSP
ncbi:hypothetical protein WJX81_000225 [Elliptochloris bilobata]|uniref:Uncharacterized protein n=1 Tax=Elliptochloris bilobata TaxID=381761 RepID=A0AAW1QCS7_9CHLO